MIENLGWIIGIVAAVVLTGVFGRSAKTAQSKDEKVDDDKKNYERKAFLSASEKNFLQALKVVEKHELVVVPQVNLATVVKKLGDYKWQNELYRNIDFGVFTKDYKLLLLVELNDSSHKQGTRAARDNKVRDILKQANIRLVTFYTNKPNKPDYVESRVIEEIKSLINQK